MTGISKEAELFEKANIVDVGLQPNEFKQRANTGDNDDEAPLSIDEVDKVDNNIVVDKAFQRSLDQRAIQFAGVHLSASSFPAIPKPKVDYRYTDKFSLEHSLDEWFTAKEWSKLQCMKDLLTERSGSIFQNLDYIEKEDFVIELTQKCDNELKQRNLSLLLYIAAGCPVHSETFEVDLDTITESFQLLIRVNILPWLIQELEVQFNLSSKAGNNLAIYSQNLFNCCSILYIIVLSSIESNNLEIKKTLSYLPLLDNLMKFIDTWKYNSKTSLRIRNIILLLSKSLQLIFGDLESREKSKQYLLQKYQIKKPEEPNKLTASPIDFHIFRNEVTGRYPAFIPPPSELPDGFEQQSSLTKYINIQKTSCDLKNYSISDPPPYIHISTPAPSPSSSPIRVSKIKKTLQASQNYPLIYPVGTSEGVVPKSIQEATELISSSVIHSLSLKQLWIEVTNFEKQERGWIDVNYEDTKDEFNYSNDTDENYGREIAALLNVEAFYQNNIPYLTSLVHVLLQIIINSKDDHILMNKIDTEKSRNSQNSLELLRIKGSILKESTYILVLLLKWFKVNHILKFENFCTLIYDANYLGIMNQYLKTLGADLHDRIKSTSLNRSNFSKTGTIDEDFCFTFRNLLTILSKIVSKKAQRVMTLCENDIPLSLRNVFVFYNLDIWHPVLKILKEITPFKGKKWKSNNMDLISMVYLHQKPGLRDKWLTGRDIASEENDAYGQEISLRALVQFYNVKNYPLSMSKLGYEKRSGDFLYNTIQGL